MRYLAFEAMIAPARAKSQIWRLVVGIIGIMLAMFATYAVLGILLADHSDLFDLTPGYLGTTPFSALVILFSFAPLSLATIAVSRSLHGRPLISLFGPLDRLRQDGFRPLRYVLLLAVLMAFLPGDVEAEVTPNLTMSRWLAVLPLSILGLLIQTSAEELFFRGYVQGQLAARFRSPIVWMLIPALIFGAAHYDPVMGDLTWAVVLWATLFGMVTADLTARAGNLWPAIALHFINNAMAMLFVANEGNLSGLSLYTVAFDPNNAEGAAPLLLLDLGFIVCAWLACRLAIRR